MLDRNQLSEISRSFADSLFREFVEWEQLAELLPGSDDGEGAMSVTVEQPETARALWIRTDDGEITVGFDLWHSHYGPFQGTSAAESIESALTGIRGIIAETSLVVIGYRGGKWAHSSLEDAGTDITAAFGETTNVYSWRRTHDRLLSP